MLDGWHEFYILLGTAAAALVALLFVAVSIGAGFLSRESASATRTFMSPVIFHYASVLFLSLIALIPTHTAISLAAAIGVVAAVGLLYSVMILIRVLRDPVGDTADALAYGACARRLRRRTRGGVAAAGARRRQRERARHRLAGPSPRQYPQRLGSGAGACPPADRAQSAVAR